MTTRREFLGAAALAAAAPMAPAKAKEQISGNGFGYVDWDWQRWRQMTDESKPRIRTEQSHKADLADLLRFGSQPVTNKGEWEAQRELIKRQLSSILGSPPASKPALDPKVTEEVSLDTFTRRKLVYHAGADDSLPSYYGTVPAYLLIPKKLKGRAPAVVCPHQTTQLGMKEPAGLGGDPRLWTALSLVNRGYVTFTYDALCFGARHKPGSGHYGDAMEFYRAHHGWSLMSKMAWDLSRGIDFLETLDFVDPKRIGCIGSSHGGYTTLFSMAYDERIAAGVCNCGFDTLRYDGNVWRWSFATALTPRLGFYLSSPYINMGFYSGVPDSEVINTPVDLHEIAALVAPRPLFLSVSDTDTVFPNSGWSARKALQLLEPIYELFDKPKQIKALYFNGGHTFPQEVSSSAYDWLDLWLKS
ncbi:MAG: prolyl oligopeptidase family serine peptidase [Acidobacteriota bacterium]|nr:prolyl oligopeptidase family serine peptidase [Acidobacteriota bacterium]